MVDPGGVQACAEIVARGDPDRFAAAMAAPVEARKTLLPLYAFNVEVARAPWVTEEPMIGEMRLQWWRDVLEEIAAAKVPRKHEVAEPLAAVLDAQGAALLDKVVAVRRWDLYKDPFEDMAHFEDYIRAGGVLMWVAARALGAQADAAAKVTATGRAAALARYLQAVPELEARSRIPLVDGRPEALRELATATLKDMPGRRDLRASLPRPARTATLEAWASRPILRQVVANPARVGDASLGLAEFAKRGRLLWWSLTM